MGRSKKGKISIRTMRNPVMRGGGEIPPPLSKTLLSVEREGNSFSGDGYIPDLQAHDSIRSIE